MASEGTLELEPRPAPAPEPSPPLLGSEAVSPEIDAQEGPEPQSEPELAPEAEPEPEPELQSKPKPAPAPQSAPARYAVAARAQAAHAARIKEPTPEPEAKADLLINLQERVDSLAFAPRQKLRILAIGAELEKARAELSSLGTKKGHRKSAKQAGLASPEVLHPFTNLPNEAQGYRGFDHWGSMLRNIPNTNTASAQSTAVALTQQAVQIRVNLLEEKLATELASNGTSMASIYSPGRISRAAGRGTPKAAPSPVGRATGGGHVASLAVPPAMMAHARTPGRVAGDVISRLQQQRRYLRQMSKRMSQAYANSLKAAVGNREITNHKGETVVVKKSFKTLPANFGEQDHAIRGGEAEEERLNKLVSKTQDSNIYLDAPPPPVVQVGALPAAWSEAAGSVPLGTRSTMFNWAISEFGMSCCCCCCCCCCVRYIDGD